MVTIAPLAVRSAEAASDCASADGVAVASTGVAAVVVCAGSVCVVCAGGAGGCCAGVAGLVSVAGLGFSFAAASAIIWACAGLAPATFTARAVESLAGD